MSGPTCNPTAGGAGPTPGLIGGAGRSLLVDTLFDLRLTAEMLEEMRRATRPAQRIATVVNTHANGDHCYGNALLAESEIIATARCAEEMLQLPPAAMAAMMRSRTRSAPPAGSSEDLLAVLLRGRAAVAAHPDVRRQLDLQVGERTVSLVEVGPAHTAGDAVVHLPDEGRVHRGHPLPRRPPHRVGGAGGDWIAACDRSSSCTRRRRPRARPAGDGRSPRRPEGILRAPDREARAGFDAGMTPLDAARDIDLGPYTGWGEPERVVANIHALYRDFGGGRRRRPGADGRDGRPRGLKGHTPGRPALRGAAWTVRGTTRERRPGRQPGGDGSAPPVIGGRYRIDGLLGEGGMARVFDVFDERLERPVAVKILRPETGGAWRASGSGSNRRRALPPGSSTPTSSPCSTSAKTSVVVPRHGAPPGTTLRDEIVARGPLPQHESCSSSARPSRPWRPPTGSGCCTATSSRATSYFNRTATQRSPTSASPRASTSDRTPVG